MKKFLRDSDKMFENNQVSLVGEIISDFTYSHEVYGEGFYMVELSVNRLSNFVDYIPVMVSERLIDVTQDYRGAYVYINGQFRSFNRHEEHKNRLVLSVFARERMAGLSDTKVDRIPRLDAPGKPYIGRINGEISLLSRLIMPNSAIRFDSAPVTTDIAIMKNTVLRSRSCAVFIIVLNRLPMPIMLPRAPKPPNTTKRTTKVSSPTDFFCFI